MPVHDTTPPQEAMSADVVCQGSRIAGTILAANPNLPDAFVVVTAALGVLLCGVESPADREAAADTVKRLSVKLAEIVCNEGAAK